MKKSLMSNIKNFVDSNVRHRIDKASHNNSEFFTDDLLLVERHFEDIRHVCIDAEKKISTLLQSIQSSNSTTQISAYTHNVQTGLNSLSHNFTHQTSSSIANVSLPISNLGHVQKSTSNEANQSGQYRSEESLSNILNPSIHNSNKYIEPMKHESTGNVEAVSIDQQQFSDDVLQRHKKLPIVGFLRFMTKTTHKLKSDSLLAISFKHLTYLQTQLTTLYLNYEQLIESQCLKPIQHILEVDIPNVVRLRKSFIKSYNDLESFKAKYAGASQKQQQQLAQQQSQQQSSSTSYTVAHNSAQQFSVKLDQLKKELDDAVMRFEQAKDTYEAEIYGFVCREMDLVNTMLRFYNLQADYHQQVSAVICNSLPTLNNTLDRTPRKFAFGTALDEHLRCTGRKISPVLELCVHLLYSQGLKEEGLFRIPGSSIKIKRLKNAINAWFVNLTSLKELESDQSRQTGHSCITALHDIFMNVVGKLPEASTKLESATPDSDDGSSQTNNDQEVLLDVHSIAGLLKLYLRELPEPLFTYTLYDRWLSALNVNKNNPPTAVKNSETTTTQQRNELRLQALKKVISDLPEDNYANLRHLIRFLNLLTCNQQCNKMTSTNLAIAMAPSLIWSKPPESKDPSLGDDEVVPQYMSMSSFGISASMHAMLVDALINNAETLFPDSIDFSLSEFKELSLTSSKLRDSKRAARSDRPLKSTSPAGFSVASSSSFSSNSSNPNSANHLNATSSGGLTVAKTHSRKGGSIDGLTSVTGDIKGSISACNSVNEQTSTETSRPLVTTVQRGNAFKSTRPASVQIRREDYSTLVHQSSSSRPKAPPVPPVPLTRSQHVKQHHRNNSREVGDPNDNETPIQQKPPAPPVPPPSKFRQELLKGTTATAQNVSSSNHQNDLKQEPSKQATSTPRPVSLRGTGTISSSTVPSLTNTMTDSVHSSSVNNNPNSIRPTVPPPDRPPSRIATQKPTLDEPDSVANNLQRNEVNSGSPTSISVEDTDRDDTKSISPVISLESLAAASSSDPSRAASITGDSSYDEIDSSSLVFPHSDDVDRGGSKSECSATQDEVSVQENEHTASKSKSSIASGKQTTDVIDGIRAVQRADVSENLSSSESNLHKATEARLECLANDQPGRRSCVGKVLTSSNNERVNEDAEQEAAQQRTDQPPVRPPRIVSPKSAAPAQQRTTTHTAKPDSQVQQSTIL